MLTPNHSLILKQIHDYPEITRTALGELTQLSQATIIRLVSDLREMEYVIQHRPHDSQNGPGRPSMTLNINPDLGYVVGLEFGQDYLMACIINAVGQPVYSYRVIDVPVFKPNDSTFDRLSEIVHQIVDDAGIPWSKINAAGLALHGVVNADGEWLLWPETGDLYPARQRLEERLDQPVYVEDVSRAFAEAEHRFGSGMQMPDMIYVFVGSRGIGAGVFINDVLLKCTSGVCGELGHIIIEDDGKLCQCGNRGCLETVATHDAVVQRLRDRLRQGVISSLSDDESLTFAQVCQAADAGDKEANIALAELATHLAHALAGTINIVGATHVLIGGQLRLAGAGFLTDLSSLLRRRLLPVLAQRLRVDYAVLPAYAGSWGVAAQALDIVWDNNRSAQLVHHLIGKSS